MNLQMNLPTVVFLAANSMMKFTRILRRQKTLRFTLRKTPSSERTFIRVTPFMKLQEANVI